MMPKLRAPIVLVHGLFGFNRVQVAGCTVASYFPGIPQALEAAGNRTLAPSLSPTGGVGERARQLKEAIDRFSPTEPVHLIAHSLGGLDARYLISRLGMAERVLSLTTLGTPHRGTAFADWAVGKLERLVRPALGFLGVPMQAFYDLTTTACAAFNAATPDAPGVRYFSVAGRHDGSVLDPGWLLPYNIVLQAEGPNDGVVSQASARYGEAEEVWDGDHFSLVNWLNPMGLRRTGAAVIGRYEKLVQRLADAGF